MPHIKPKSLNPQHGTGYHGAILAEAGESLAANDLVVASGYTGDRIKVRKAQADDAAMRLGFMAIADHAAASGASVRLVTHKLITGVDTSASTALGHPVYLSDTAGGWTPDASATTTDIVVGTVLVDHASTGAVLLAPAHSVGIE